MTAEVYIKIKALGIKMNKPLKILFIFFIISVAGCSTTRTHIGQLPTIPSDFTPPIEQIKETYPEVKKYDGYLHCGVFGTKCEYMWTIFDMPPVSELVALWGEPDEVKPSLLNLNLFGMFGLHPYKVYIWYKGNYKIEAEVDHPAAFKWEPHLAYWRWYLQDSTTDKTSLTEDKKKTEEQNNK